MTATADRRGVPNVRAMIPRARLNSLSAASLHEVVLLVAPSGSGKTVTAAQWAQRHLGPVFWVSLRGHAVDLDAVLRQLLLRISISLGPEAASLRSDQPAHDVQAVLADLEYRKAWVVFDDLVSDDLPIFELLDQLARTLCPLVERIIVTTRVHLGCLVSRQPMTIIDGTSLSFDPREAKELARRFSPETQTEDIERLRKEFSGHAALLRMALTAPFAVEGVGLSEPALATQVVVERLVTAHLETNEREALQLACLLQEGSIADLERLGIEDARRKLESIAGILPLVRVENAGPAAHLVFSVHDLVGDCISRGARASEVWDKVDFTSLINVLADQEKWVRAYTLLKHVATDRQVVAFLKNHGDAMISKRCPHLVLRLVNSVPLHQIMDQSRVLLLWSTALHEVGEIGESVAKAAAAMRLAEHERDFPTFGLAVAQRVQALLDQGRAQDAVDVSEAVAVSTIERMSPLARAEFLLSYGTALGVVERRQEAIDAFAAAETAAMANRSSATQILGRLRRVRAYSHAIWFGDYARSVNEVAPLVSQGEATQLEYSSLKGNLGWMLMEIGRLGRAEALLSETLESENHLLEASFLPVLGLIRAAKGHLTSALVFFEKSHAAAVSCQDEADIQVNRLYEACIRRADGQVDVALDLAERSFEMLSSNDFLGMSRLAAVEVAASLLALGDSPGARTWLGEDVEVWFSVNRYHALAGAMVLAVADCREGDNEDAIERLKPFSAYIKSDSANWRMAMYCRTYPELLGVLTMAVGAAQLPIHMLRMVLPENVERTLRLSKGLLPRDEWEILGRRGLGEEQFEAYLQRKGRPICRVHLFGGLEVLAGERPVVERDWRKRKARLLFSRLVIERGRELSRDVILEALWPEMPESNARNNFYVVWSTMKSALTSPEERDAGCPYIESTRGRCRIVRDAVRSDIDQFEELDARARKAESEGNLDDAINALQELMTVYRGDLLPGDIYDDWFAEAREEYRRRFLGAMLLGANLLLEADDPLEALIFIRRAMQVDRYREDLYQMALRCHVAAGQRSAAIETYIKCKTELAEMYGLDPCDETMRIYDEVLAMEEKPRYESYGLSRKSSRDSTDW